MKKALAVLAMLVAAVVFFAYLLPNIEFKIHVERADARVGDGKYYQAEIEARKALTIHPDRASAHFLLGIALAEQHKEDAGISELRRAIALNAKLAAAHHALAHLLEISNPEAAIDEYQTVLQLEPNNANARQELGQLQMLVDTRALEHANKQLEEVNQDLRQSTAALGVIEKADAQCFRPGWVNPSCACDYKTAVSEYREGLAEDPYNAEAHAHLGVLLQTFIPFLHKDSVEEFRKAADLGPDTVLYRLELAWALGEEGQYDEAGRVLQNFLTTHPNDVNTGMYSVLGDLRRNAHDRSGAMAYYNTACHTSPAKEATLACSYVQGTRSLNPDPAWEGTGYPCSGMAHVVQQPQHADDIDLADR